LVAPIFTLVGVVLGSGGTIANSLLTAGRTSKDKKAEADLKLRLEKPICACLFDGHCGWVDVVARGDLAEGFR